MTRQPAPTMSSIATLEPANAVPPPAAAKSNDASLPIADSEANDDAAAAKNNDASLPIADSEANDAAAAAKSNDASLPIADSEANDAAAAAKSNDASLPIADSEANDAAAAAKSNDASLPIADPEANDVAPPAVAAPPSLANSNAESAIEPGPREPPSQSISGSGSSSGESDTPMPAGIPSAPHRMNRRRGRGRRSQQGNNFRQEDAVFYTTVYNGFNSNGNVVHYHYNMLLPAVWQYPNPNPNPNPNFGYGVDPMWPAPPPQQHQQAYYWPPPHQPAHYSSPPRHQPVYPLPDDAAMNPVMGIPVPPAPTGTAPTMPAQDLLTRIQNQIEYYFSDPNLQGDAYLKGQMDRSGWIDINLIARFNMVRSLTRDLELVKRAMASSYTVELMGDKVRQRHGWRRWILPNKNRNSLKTGVQTWLLSDN